MRQIWGGRRAVRELVSLLNWLKRHGYDGARLAEYLGISKQSVSKWRVGTNSPTEEKLAAMRELRTELEKAGTPGNIPGNAQETKLPVEYEKMPIPINVIIDNNDQTPLTSAPEGAAEPACARCPLRGRPRVGGGRGKGVHDARRRGAGGGRRQERQGYRTPTVRVQQA